MYPAALHDNLNQTIGSSQISERWIVQKQPKIIHKVAKNWDQKSIRDLEQVCPKLAHHFYLDCCRQRQLCPDQTILLDLSQSF